MKPSLIVLAAAVVVPFARAHAAVGIAPESATPPAPTPARLSSSRLEIPVVACLPSLSSATTPPGSPMDGREPTLRPLLSGCQHTVLDSGTIEPKQPHRVLLQDQRSHLVAKAGLLEIRQPAIG